MKILKMVNFLMIILLFLIRSSAYNNSNVKLALFTKKNKINPIHLSDTVLKITTGIDQLGSLEYPLVIALFLGWLIVFSALSKGVASLGKISYFTATFPYVITDTHLNYT